MPVITLPEYTPEAESLTPCRTDRIKTPTICGLLPIRYHYELQVTRKS